MAQLVGALVCNPVGSLSSAEAFCLTDYFIYYYRGERSEEQVTFKEKDAAGKKKKGERLCRITCALMQISEPQCKSSFSEGNMA